MNKTDNEKQETNEKLKKMTDFVVIGLGRFGRSLATSLFAYGNEVLAIDTKPENVKAIENKVSTAVVADATNKDVLHSLGAQNFDCAIVCIGDNLEASILTTQICKELEIPYIIAKAQNVQHGKILNSVGANLLIFPEEFMGNKLATVLSKPGINDLVDLTDEFKIFEMPTPEPWQEKSIKDLNIRKKYNLTIVYIKRENEVIAPDADTMLKEGDSLVLAGEKYKLNSLVSIANDAVDIVDVLNKTFINHINDK